MVWGGMISLGVLAVWVSWTYFLILHFSWNILEIQLFFSISIFVMIALKGWNFPDNLNFNRKIMTKFLIRSLISVNLKWYDNINRGLFKNYVTWIMVFFIQFHFVKFSQFYFTTPSVLLTKIHLETIEWMKRRLFAYMLLENHIFKDNWIFRPFCMYKQPTLPEQ